MTDPCNEVKQKTAVSSETAVFSIHLDFSYKNAMIIAVNLILKVHAMIYLDYAAHAPADPVVLERFCDMERRLPANPNSVHAAGKAAR